MNITPEIRHFRAFGAWLQTPLSTLLHETVAVRCVGRDVMPVGVISETVFYFRLIGVDFPPGTVWGIEFEPTLLFSLLDRLQGGSATLNECQIAGETNRRLTSLEKRLTHRILLLFQNALRETWKVANPFEFETVAEEDLPNGIWHGVKNITAVHFQFDVGTLSGTFHILFPSTMKHRVFPGNLSIHDEIDISDSIAQTPVRISVQMTGGKVLPQDLMSWQVGNLISLERTEDFPFSVLVEGVEKFSASPGKYKSRKAFKIL